MQGMLFSKLVVIQVILLLHWLYCCYSSSAQLLVQVDAQHAALDSLDHNMSLLCMMCMACLLCIHMID